MSIRNAADLVACNQVGWDACLVVRLPSNFGLAGRSKAIAGHKKIVLPVLQMLVGGATPTAALRLALTSDQLGQTEI